MAQPALLETETTIGDAPRSLRETRGAAVVVGAGPAGAVMAMFLARQGFGVQVYEARPEEDVGQSQSRQTFIMALTQRGVGVLQELGVQLPNGNWVGGITSAKAIVRHDHDGSVTKRDIPTGGVACERAKLASHLVNEAKRLYGSQIQFNFGSTFQDVDFDRKQATFQNSSGDSIEARYDLLVGADGNRSRVRGAMERQLDLTCSRQPSEIQYRTFQGLPHVDLDGRFKIDDHRPGCSIHMWRADTTVGPLRPGFGAWLTEDGTYGAIMQIDPKGLQLPSSVDEYEALIRRTYTDLPEEWIPMVAARSVDAPLYGWGATVESSKLSARQEGVALVGDAAHGVTPNLGQGCNSALETCAILNQALEGSPDSIADALSAFEASRRKQTQALAHLDRISGKMQGMDGKFNIHFLITLCHMLVSGTLHKLLPAVFAKPAMMRVFQGNLPYTQLLWARRRDFTLAVAALLAAAYGLARLCAAVFFG